MQQDLHLHDTPSHGKQRAISVTANVALKAPLADLLDQWGYAVAEPVDKTAQAERVAAEIDADLVLLDAEFPDLDAVVAHFEHRRLPLLYVTERGAIPAGHTGMALSCGLGGSTKLALPQMTAYWPLPSWRWLEGRQPLAA